MQDNERQLRDDPNSNDRRYNDFLKDSGNILDETASVLEQGPAVPVSQFLAKIPRVITDILFISNKILMTSVRLVNAISPETVQERTAAIVKSLTTKTVAEGKLQVLKFGEGTILLEGHGGIIYATSWYGQVSKDDMKFSHKAVVRVHGSYGVPLLQLQPLPDDFVKGVCACFGIQRPPAQEEVVPAGLARPSQSLPGYKGDIMREREHAQGLGFDVTRLTEALNLERQKAEQVLKAYKTDIERGEHLLKSLDELDPSGFEGEHEKIIILILSLKNLDEAKMEMHLLKKKMDKKKDAERLKLEKLKKEIDAIQARGYIVPHLLRLFQTGNIQAIENALIKLEADLDQLKELEDRGKKLREQGFDIEMDAVMHNFMDPSKIPFLEQRLKKMEDEVCAEEIRKKLFSELDGKMKEWEQLGFKTENLRNSFTSDPDTIKAAVADFEDRVKQLISLEATLETLRGKGADKEIDALKPMISDVNNLEAVENGLVSIKASIERSGKGPRPRIPKLMRKEELIELIGKLPKGLPSTLWGRPVESLADEILNSPIGNTPEKKIVVRVTRRWYFYDTDDPENFLQPFSGTAIPLKAEDLKNADVQGALDVPTVKARLVGVPEDQGRRGDASRPSYSKEELRHIVGRRMDRRELTDDMISKFTPIKCPYEMKETEVLEAISSLPRGLPSSIMTTDLEELAKSIINAKYAQTPKGEVVICLDSNWYYGNPHQLGRYLQVYRG